MNIQIPTLDLRHYQRRFWQAMEAGARRAAPIWPRRSGKDTISLQWTSFAAHQKVANYWHLFPEQTQARKAIWKGIDKEGQRIIDRAFPREIRKSTNESEMLIELHNGSTWQLGGSDRYDALVGSNPGGVIFSEYAIADPRAYDFIRPILAENGGWALFPFTPRGRNHGYDLYQKLMADNQSFAEVLTCDDTGHMTAEVLDLERKEMSEELFLQEYYASWNFGIEGSYYAKQMNRAVEQGRVTHCPYDESLPVFAGGDIGLHDSTSIWFVQIGRGGDLRWIDHETHSGEQIKFYADMLKAKPYTLGGPLILPHDGKQTRLGMARSVAQQFNDQGIATTVLPQTSTLQADIESCRVAINKSVFDEELTRLGRASLSAYRREKDERRNVFKDTPLHDWASDDADGFRYMVQAYNANRLMTDIDWNRPVDYSNLNRAAI